MVTTIKCKGCEVDSWAPRSGSVGTDMEASGFQWFMTHNGESVWLCRSCTGIAVQGYRLIESVAKEQAPYMALNLLAKFANLGRKKEEEA